MKRLMVGISSLVLAFATAGQVEAFTETGEKVTVPVGASGTVTASSSLDVAVVTQSGGADEENPADDVVVAGLSFGSGGNAFRDSDESLRVTVDTNLAGNRIIVYTNNLGLGADPTACLNTAEGIDGGGLVGETDCAQIVPMLWAINDNDVDHGFTTGTIGDDEIFVTDRAHVATFTTEGDALDNMAMVRCDDEVTPVANTLNDGLYPQSFGTAGANSDVCNAAATETVVAQELSKNIAVIGFNFLGTNGTVPELNPLTVQTSQLVTSPFYLPFGANFTSAPAQAYSTNTLTVELVTQ